MLMLPYPALAGPCVASSSRDPIVRSIDLLLSAALLLFLAPLLLIVATAIGLQDGGSPLFIQRRLGKGGCCFRVIKFRTMTIGAEQRLSALLASDPAARAAWRHRQKVTADPRVTRLGHFLRRSSIDELPQLFNVLKGDMSLVGPRPIVAAEVGHYGRHFAVYCRRRPGLSGLWQVTGRSRVGYARRLACDRLFARRRSLRLYCRILAATVPAVLLARGAC